MTRANIEVKIQYQSGVLYLNGSQVLCQLAWIGGSQQH